MREPECTHPVVLYGTAPGELRPERAVCVGCRRIVTVEFWADDRAVAFAAIRRPSPHKAPVKETSEP